MGTEDPWFRVDVREFETRSHPAQASVSSLLTRGRYRELESSRPVCGFESLSRVSFPLVDSVRPRFSAYPYDRAKGRRGACFLHCVIMSSRRCHDNLVLWWDAGSGQSSPHRSWWAALLDMFCAKGRPGHAEQWKQVLQVCSEHGTRSVVFTGGEPLVRKDIGDIIKFAKELGLYVTLSTNTLLLKKRAREVLPYVDEIGIPLDGSPSESNARMRIGSAYAYESAIMAMHFVKQHHAHIEVTIRTVVSKVNSHDISNIGQVLSDLRSFWDRWKLYEFNPISIGDMNRNEHELAHDMFDEIVLAITQRWPEFPIVPHPVDIRTGRYLFIGPDGELFAAGPHGSDVIVGSWRELVEGRLRYDQAQVVDPRRNRAHGVPRRLSAPIHLTADGDSLVAGPYYRLVLKCRFR